MPEPSEACGVLGAGLSKERMMLPNTTERSCEIIGGKTPHLIFYSCCLKILVVDGSLKMIENGYLCMFLVRTQVLHRRHIH